LILNSHGRSDLTSHLDGSGDGLGGPAAGQIDGSGRRPDATISRQIIAG
jgi:hypothetical protein